MVLDNAGKPHMESCDPGIYPSYFLDFGRKAGAEAWLDIIRTHLVNGTADGIYVDCDPNISTNNYSTPLVFMSNLSNLISNH